ncbi:unnamed protein product [Rotaria magnacalcarata]
MTSPPRLIVVSYPAFLSLVCGTVYWSTTVQDDSDELIVVFIVSYFSTSGLDRSVVWIDRRTLASCKH